MNRIAALFAAVVVVSAAALARDQPPASGPVVELPKFVVTDTRELPPPEAWRYGTIDGFEIITNASDRATQRLLRDFDMFRQALSYVWPIPKRFAQPASLIISGRGGKFDTFVPAGRTVPDAGFASISLKDGNRSAIVIDLQATTLNVLNVDDSNDAATGTDSGLIAVEHDKLLYREYVRFLLSRNEPRLPAWFEEGLSQIMMKMRFDRRWIEFAKLEDPNEVSTSGAMVAAINAASQGEDVDIPALPGAPAEDRDFPAALRRRALVPLDKFFAVPHDSPEATNILGNNIWAKQAYAFVHMCLYGENGKFQKPFTSFLLRAQREPVTEELFEACFNMSYKKMLIQLRGYCEFTVYKAQGFRSKKGGEDLIVPAPPIELRDATEAEIGRIKGETLLMAGHTKAARTELIAPYIRGERDPELLASLGLFERAHGEEERARKFLEAAFAGKAKRPEALLELARLRYAEALAKPHGANQTGFSEQQAADILAPLLAAREQPPHLVAVYELIGDTWARSPAKPKPEDARVLIAGAQLFPARLKLIYQAAALAADAGEIRPAHQLVDHGIKWAPDASVKQHFESLKASLPPMPAASSPAPGAK